ncbi:MAG TPA: head GIN domain-containing protein [Saprospiraceae bacterium]|nr:head GIN domain-containing protein [Saprospiraceae bacterium]
MKFIYRIHLFSFLFLGVISLQAQNWRGQISGEGPVVEKNLSLSEIDALGLSISATVHLMQGNSQQIRIKAQQNIIDNIETDVSGGTWNIEFDQNVRRHESIDIYVTLKNIKKLAVAGSGSIIGEKEINTGEIVLAVAGSGDIILDLQASKAKMGISGSGNIRLNGHASSTDISISGSGSVRALGFESDNCSVSIAGSGNCEVDVNNDLKVSVSGSGNVLYEGAPSIHSSIIGSGKVRSKS